VINCSISGIRCVPMLAALACALLSTTPPLVQAPPERSPLVPAPENVQQYPQAPAPTYLYPRVPPSALPRSRVRPQPAPPEPPLEPARFGLFFSPFGIFALSFFLEGDLALAGGFDVFANVGGGPLGQFAFDAGFRHYVLGTSLDGFYFDVRGSGFGLPASGLWMFGPGMQIGYGWRVKRFTLSIAVGVTTWYGTSRWDGSTRFFNSNVVDEEIIVFPGFTQPPVGRPGVQPTLRVSLGPWF